MGRRTLGGHLLVWLVIFVGSNGNDVDEAVKRCGERGGSPWIFVRGLHHSGTTLTTRVLDLHTGVIGFRNTKVPADEGQHLQSVYPVANTMWNGHLKDGMCREDTYRCPSLTGGNASWAKMCQDWIPILLQDGHEPYMYLEKTPVFLIPFLATAAREMARVVMVLRHPFWYRYPQFVVGGRRNFLSADYHDGAIVQCNDKTNASPACVAAWMAIWTGVLTEDLPNVGDQLRSWIVFRYEAFRNPDLTSTVSSLLTAVGLDDSDFPFTRVHFDDHHRSLEYRNVDGIDNGDVVVDPKHIPLLSDLPSDFPNPFAVGSAGKVPPCRDLVNIIEDVFSYDLDNNGNSTRVWFPIFLASPSSSEHAHQEHQLIDVATKLSAFAHTGAAAACFRAS